MNTKQYTYKGVFDLESGGQLLDPVITYNTYGRLNEKRDNVIVVCHALTANSEVHDWWHGFFGEGKLFDPQQYFIICANNLGSPYGSASPKTIDPVRQQPYGVNFPFYTIRDKAKLQLLLLEYLQITGVNLLIGGSCGGNIAQEMAIDLGSNLEKLVLLCCSAKETPWVVGIHESQRIALRSDPTFGTGELHAGKEGLRGARAFALPFYRSYECFVLRQSEDNDEKINEFRAASYIAYQGEKFVNRYHPLCYDRQLTALDTHNIGRGHSSIDDALGLIVAETLVIGFNTDLLIPVTEQKYLAEAIPTARYFEVETVYGHDAFLIEYDKMMKGINQFYKHS